ncbi:MAG: ligand-binding sensor domain-containing protein, partial [Limisphaerales bacterium]
GTWGGGLNELKDGKITTYTARKNKNSLSSDLVMALEEDHEGALWIGTDFNGGLNRFKNGEFTHYQKEHGLTSAILALHEDRHQRLWIGSETALHCFREGKFDHYTKADGLAGNNIYAICEDHEDNLWFGTGNGLSKWNNGKFSNFTEQNGLSKNAVISLCEDSEGHLWIGTRGSGLLRKSEVRSQKSDKNETASDLRPLTSSFSTYTTRQGLFNDNIYEILDDGRGDLWMSGPNGIFRVRKKHFDEFDRGKIKRLVCTSYGKSDGLITTKCNGVAKPSIWKTRDGRLWFCTIKGLAVAESNIKVNDVPPPVAIEEIIADKQKSGVRSPSSDLRPLAVTIPPGNGEIEFQYTALSFQAPEKNRFKYKLDGLDSDWVDAGTRRSAFYSHMAPGTYTFHVIACNNDGIWNESGARVKFTLQ